MFLKTWTEVLSLLLYKKFALDLNPDLPSLKCAPHLRTSLLSYQEDNNIMWWTFKLQSVLWLHSFVPQKIGSHPVHMHNSLHCHLPINSFNVAFTFLLDENKRPLSATGQRIRKGVCSMDLFYGGYLFSDILTDVPESALKYPKKLQVMWGFFFHKIQQD